MLFIKRLRLVSGVLGCAAVGAVITGIVFGDAKPTAPAVAIAPGTPITPKLIDELAKTKFSEQPTLSYQTTAGETVFAWQIKPVLAASAKPRPRDILVMVDTSASQSGEPLKQAVQIMATLVRQLNAEDRVDLWTINLDHKDLTRSLTNGFQPANDESLKQAVVKFHEREYGAGAVDLKSGLENAIKAFDHKAGREQVIVYLGDGESAAGTPITEPMRAELGHRMVDKNIQIFAVPLGSTLCAENLHGLTTLTGGSVVRVQEDLKFPASRDAFHKRLVAALDVPVLRADKVAFGPADAEVFPNRLPPLRGDRSTLIMGKLKGPAASLTLKIEGTVGDNKATIDLAERLPASQMENFFLNPMLQQWQAVEAKNTPALLPADRTLAMASEQFRLYRDEFVEIGLRAINADRYDHAEQLFKAAAKIDPNHGDATEGLKIVADLRSGVLTKEKLQQRVKNAEKAGQVFLKQEPTPAPGGAVIPAPAPAGPMPSDLDKRIAARNVAEQEQKAVTEEILKRATILRKTDPDTAYDDLKRQRDSIVQNGDLSDNVRRKLAADLEAQMRDIQVQGGEIKRKLAAEREKISQVRYRLNENDRLQTLEDQTKARIDRFRDLMSQARFELAYQEAQVLIEERINRGMPVPPEVAATYRIGQSATSLREYRELKRVREDRYLLTMLQVEKSFIPYPDEPPMHFPPASVWRELRKTREANVNSLIFGTQGATGLVKIRSVIEDLDESGQPSRSPRRVNMPLPLKDQRVKDVLEKLEKDFGVRIVIRYDLLNVGDNPDRFEERKFKMDVNLSGLTLGAFLDIALLDVGASYFVRPEYIEVTTKLMRIEEKVTRAFAVGDLALIPPNAVNNQALQQNLAVFGAQIQQAAGLAQAQNFVGAGAFNGGQGGQPGLPGAMGGMFQGLNQNGGNNLGVGGGIVGATGGQLGQFGNLGGQFGIQGNNQSSILVQVIQQLVARGEWDTGPAAGVANNPAPGADPSTPLLPTNLLNSIGYYPPTNALIIRATSRYHPTASFKIPLNEAAPVNVNPNILAKDDANDPKLRNPVADAKAIVKRAGKDPKKVWNETFDWAVTDPNLIVSATEVLFALNEHAHAAEAIKASLRHGHTNAEWTHEALAIALQSSQASSIEVERAAMSAIDLAPRDPKAYLRAAKAESELGRHDAAVGLCQRAATIEPNMPTAYANALVYLERSSDVKSDVVAWASSNLLSRDWANDGTDYNSAARERVGRLAGKLTALGRDGDAAILNKTLNATKTRDLVIELGWQGPADLDLYVTEPNGSVCSPETKRTIGGGVLRTNLLDQKDDARTATYTAAEAFNGNYKVQVKTALGRAIGNKASLKVIRYAGTPNEMFELFDIDLSTGKPVEFALEKGTRKDLANLPLEEISGDRMLTTAGPRTLAPSGFSGGSGRPDAATTNAVNNPITAANTMPLVPQSVEVSMPSISPALPGMRMVATVSPDKKQVEYRTNAVFAGPAVDIPLPKMRLLPGATGR